MSREELINKLNALYQELEELTGVEPKDFEEFNAVRIRYDTALAKMSAYHTQIDIIRTVEQLNTELELEHSEPVEDVPTGD